MTYLATAFQARYSVQRCVEWTNPGDPAPTTVNTTLLETAVEDVLADFLTYSGSAYDAANTALLRAQQTGVACVGVAAYLQSYLDQGGGEKRLTDFQKRLGELAKTIARDRIIPATSSLLVPTVEGLDGRTRPAFDNEAFGNVLLDGPATNQDTGSGLD